MIQRYFKAHNVRTNKSEMVPDNVYGNFILYSDHEAALAEKDKRIEVLLRTNKTHLDTMLVQTKRIAELEAERDRAQEQVDFFRLEFNKYSERCSGLISVRDKLTAERDRLREAGENLRDYLNKGTWRDFDIPDEIWGPFEKSLDGPDWIAQAALRKEADI